MVIRCFAVATMLAATVTACGDTGAEVPAVSRAVLQQDIAARLAEAGETPREVTCHADLVGEVGRVAVCDVVMSDTNSFQPIVTVTAVDGETVDYELSPALSQAQLEQAVRRLASNAGERVDAVACESGLAGEAGARASCDVDADGVRARRTVEVTDVSGLTINFNLLSS